MPKFTESFGPAYLSPPGYIAEVGDSLIYNHRFGGESWKAIDYHPVEDGPVLLFVFDLADPKLSGISSLLELPICSYINSDVWIGEQVYKIKEDTKELILVRRDERDFHVLPDNCKLPSILPERRIHLRDMHQSEYPANEESYWRNTDDFFGGNGFFRVAGNPLWVNEAQDVNCTCGLPMRHIVSIGYEDYDGPFNLLDTEPFFIGEGALYAFYCSQCAELKIISQC